MDKKIRKALVIKAGAFLNGEKRMEKKYCYNYKQVFDEPVKMYSIGKYSIPFVKSISIGSFILYVFFLTILWIFFRNLIEFANGILSGLKYAIYLGVPYLLTRQVMKLHPDGKKLHIYLIDLAWYTLTIWLYKKKYCQDQIVTDVDRRQCFEKKEVVCIESGE